MNELKYKTAVITGASRGLGRALALELAKRSVRLALVARGRAELDRVVSEVRAIHGEAYPVFAFEADVGDKVAIHPLAAQIAQVVGPPDLLVNNASQLGPLPMKLLMDLECEELQAVLGTNLLGPFRLTKVLAGQMLLRDRGLIINISSDASVEAYPKWGAYGVSKAALDHLTRTFGAELAGTGVDFLSVDPGEMNTRMHADAMPEADPRTLSSPDEVARRILRIIVSRGVSRGMSRGERLVAARFSEESPREAS